VDQVRHTLARTGHVSRTFFGSIFQRITVRQQPPTTASSAAVGWITSKAATAMNLLSCGSIQVGYLDFTTDTTPTNHSTRDPTSPSWTATGGLQRLQLHLYRQPAAAQTKQRWRADFRPYSSPHQKTTARPSRSTAPPSFDSGTDDPPTRWRTAKPPRPGERP